MIATGLFGCAPATTQSTYEIPLPPILCTPESPLVNVYRATPQPWVNTIFETAFPPYIPTPIPPNPSPYNEQQILIARYAAFLQLMNETKRWSDTETVKLNDLTETNITLTYMSPELLQAVFLNEVLKNHFPTYGFKDELQKVLNPVAARDELLFLLTVTTTNNNVNQIRHTIKIPIESMFMHTAENLTISRSHDDHNLEQLIDTSSDSVSGYLAYPITQFSASQCKWILDPKFNKNIVVDVPFIEVDGVSNNTQYSWTIPYAPLMSVVVPTNTPSWSLPFGTDPNQYPITPLTVPPIAINQTNNWQDFGRFVWGKIMLGNY
jgi:hypothetical protein